MMRKFDIESSGCHATLDRHTGSLIVILNLILMVD
jgi:hypothetical protein